MSNAVDIKVTVQQTVMWDCVDCQVNFGTTESLNHKAGAVTRTACPDCGKSYIIHWGDDEWETWVEETK